MTAVIGCASVMCTKALYLIRKTQDITKLGFQANQETASVLHSLWSAAKRYVHEMLHKLEK